MLLKYYQKLDDAISYLISSAVDEKKLLKKILNKKKITVVDIGSNEGNFIDGSLFFCLPISLLGFFVGNIFGNKIEEASLEGEAL